jgi:ABC-type spermidine/putrescine transport system permease subunit II
VSPVINALATILVVLATLAIVGAAWFMSRQDRLDKAKTTRRDDVVAAEH